MRVINHLKKEFKNYKFLNGSSFISFLLDLFVFLFIITCPFVGIFLLLLFGPLAGFSLTIMFLCFFMSLIHKSFSK